MNKKQHIGRTIKLAYRITSQRGFNKYFVRIFYSLGVCFASLALLAVFTHIILFAEIMDWVSYITAIVGVIGMILHIRDVVKQIKRNDSETDPI